MLVHVITGVVLGLPFLLKVKGVILPPVPTQIAQQCPHALRIFCETGLFKVTFQFGYSHPRPPPPSEPIDWQGLQLSAFYLNVAAGIAAFVASSFVFGSDRAVLERERGNGTSAVAFVVSRMLVDLVVIAIDSLTFAAVYGTLLRPNNEFTDILLQVFALETAMSGLGYLLSLLLNLTNCISTGLVLVFASTIFSGITPKLRVAKAELGLASVLWDLSFARWSVEASVVSNIRIFLEPETAFTESTRKFLEEYGWDERNFAFDIGMMFILGLTWRVLTILVAVWKK